MTETKVEPRPPVPAIMHLRAKHGKHYGCVRREVMAKRAPMGQHVKGFRDPRKDQDEKLNLQALTVDEKRMGHVFGGRAKFRGSKREAALRSRRRWNG
jgi:hypothetical protein